MTWIFRTYAADEIGLPLEMFPELPPFTIEQVLDEHFLPSESTVLES